MARFSMGVIHLIAGYKCLIQDLAGSSKGTREIPEGSQIIQRCSESARDMRQMDRVLITCQVKEMHLRAEGQPRILESLWK